MAELLLLREELAVCRLEGSSPIPEWAVGHPFFSITRTADEVSIVCPVEAVPPHVQAERGWRCFKVRGPLDFAQVGVLLSLAEPLARGRVSIFALSTYDTDYLLVRTKDLDRAVEALRASGHTVIEEE